MIPLPGVIYRFDDVEFTPSNLQLTVSGEARQLEPKSYRLLVFLVENGGRVVTKEEILSTVWEGVAVTDNALTRAIAQLRKALGDDPKAPRYIETVPTAGYRFIAAVRQVQANSFRSPHRRPLERDARSPSRPPSPPSRLEHGGSGTAGAPNPSASPGCAR